jgi:hypothetical protein
MFQQISHLIYVIVVQHALMNVNNWRVKPNKKTIKSSQINILDFQDCLIEEPGFDLNDFDQLMIDNIVLNSAYLMCPEDIIA